MYVNKKHGIFEISGKWINRNGKRMFRDKMGEEYPAHMILETLSPEQQKQFEKDKKELREKDKQFKRVVHPENYAITTRQAADKWGVSRKTVLAWISRGKLPEAQKFGRDWLIPNDTQKPTDRRYVENPIRDRRKKDT